MPVDLKQKKTILFCDLPFIMENHKTEVSSSWLSQTSVHSLLVT